MPYIPQTDRPGATHMPVTPGELNFTFSNAIARYVRQEGLTYGTINDVIGALEGAKLEFYRRVAVPYEDIKRQENGDVYDLDR